MLKNIDPSNKSIKPFKAYKSFTLTNNDSGSGHFVLKAVSGSTYNFTIGSASSQSFGTYVHSASAFEYGTFYDLPNWHTINQLYYKRSSEPYGNFGGNNPKKINRELNGNFNINNFCHIANYNENKGCIEVFVKSLRNQLIKINGKKIFVKEKEKIHVEDSHKYSEQQFKNIAVAAGWKNVKNWKDSNKKFSVFLLRN